MKETIPKVYLIAKTELTGTLDAYLAEHGYVLHTDAGGGEKLIEAAGRLCYASWHEGSHNPNVTKTRKGNKEYIANLLKSGHHSVLEHVNVTFLFANVSRIFTHELVRHRAGMAYSQESLRYVRLDEIKFWFLPEMNEVFPQVMELLEEAQRKLASDYDIDKLDFAEKKKLTSMFRRVAPMGLATNIIATGNLRAWRHIIELRTSKHAEMEIREVMKMVAGILREEYPNVFQDMNYSEEGITFGG